MFAWLVVVLYDCYTVVFWTCLLWLDCVSYVCVSLTVFWLVFLCSCCVALDAIALGVFRIRDLWFTWLGCLIYFVRATFTFGCLCEYVVSDIVLFFIVNFGVFGCLMFGENFFGLIVSYDCLGVLVWDVLLYYWLYFIIVVVFLSSFVYIIRSGFVGIGVCMLLLACWV